MPRSRHRKKSTYRRRRSSAETYDAADEPLGVADAIAMLVKPYLRDAETPEMAERVFSLGALAWNISLLEPQEREREVRRVARELSPPPRMRRVRLLVSMLAQRWRKPTTPDEDVSRLLGDVALEKVLWDLIERRERLFPWM